MKEIKCIIADDEMPLRRYLKEQLTDIWPDLIICGEAKNGKEALTLIEKNHPEIAFLDINMPGLSGIEVARKVVGICRVVFITAYDQYAIEAFENGAIDYILKPVSKKRLKKTVKRLKEQISKAHVPESGVVKTLEEMLTSMNIKSSSEYLQWIKAQVGNEIQLVQVEDIYYFKADDKYTVVRTKERETLIKKSIRTLIEELDPKQFWQIHRGTIVKADKIDRASRSITGKLVVKLKDLDDEPLFVSRPYAHLFKQT